MILLQINATYGIGSTGRIVKDIHKKAITKGISSYVACQNSSNPEETYKIGNKLDYKMHAVLCRINGRQAYFSKRATKKLLHFIDEIKPDIIHLHNLHNNFINLNMVLDFIIKRNISVVITLHDCWYYTGKCFHYTQEQCYRWKQSCGKCPKRKTDTPTYFFDFSELTFQDKKRRYEKMHNIYVVGVSKWIAEETKQSILKNARISYCYNGVDLSVFKPHKTNIRQKLGIDKDDFIILGMANKWIQPQNAEIVNSMCSILDNKVKIILIGVTKNMDVPERILKIPKVENSINMSDWYATADVFLNLTREDTLPFVNIEAIACGTPVITHCTSGATETINADTGVAIEPDNVEGLLGAIKMVRARGKEYYTHSCVERAKEIFNVENVYESYFQIYEEIGNGL